MEEDLVKNPPPCRLAFTRMVNRPEPAIDLAEAALLIAKEECPDLDIARYLLRLDGMAADVRNRAGGADDPARLFTDLGDYLFREQGFRGDAENYYDPRNSFLNEVLDRRLGIPISLSAVYMEVGRRLGVRLHGVGMPGHFLVKYTGSNEEVIVDRPGILDQEVARVERRGHRRSLPRRGDPLSCRLPADPGPGLRREGGV